MKVRISTVGTKCNFLYYSHCCSLLVVLNLYPKLPRPVGVCREYGESFRIRVAVFWILLNLDCQINVHGPWHLCHTGLGFDT